MWKNEKTCAAVMTFLEESNDVYRVGKQCVTPEME